MILGFVWHQSFCKKRWNLNCDLILLAPHQKHLIYLVYLHCFKSKKQPTNLTDWTCYFWRNQMQWITSITTKSIWGALLISQQLSDTLETFRSLCSETITKIFRSQHLVARTSGHNLSCLLAWLDLHYKETWSAMIGWRHWLSKQQECMYTIYCKYAILYASEHVDNLKCFTCPL